MDSTTRRPDRTGHATVRAMLLQAAERVAADEALHCNLVPFVHRFKRGR